MTRKIPHKRKEFIKKFTDVNNSETFGNGTQSVLASYPSVKSANVAKSMASEILTNPDIKQAIEKRIRSKEDDQQTLQQFVTKLEAQLNDGTITPENSALLRELREFIKLQGQFRGDFVERSVNVNVNANISAKESATLDTNELIDALTRR